MATQTELTEIVVGDQHNNHVHSIADAPRSHRDSTFAPSSVEDTLIINNNNNGKAGFWRNLYLAYNTLGVVFGGLVTSPLYVYPSMHLNSPSEEDYLSIYSIMFWTLTLIGVVKYCLIALKADDQGEGGTFALYSLLCRHANISILSSRRTNSNSDLQNPNQYRGDQKKTKLAIFLERSLISRRVLLFVAMLGTCMLIADGILTPAVSVLSAMEGLNVRFPSITKTVVKAISSSVLFILCMVQRFGTSKVSCFFSPIMFTWTITTPMVGIYNIIRHYPSIFKALSPLYILRFFMRNGKQGWMLLGGTVLCITGSEALFADLGHFNRSSIQMAFLFTIYPSLILTYAGQTAYLIKHPNDHDDGFYKFVPGRVYFPMFVVATLAATVASQSLISATFSIIKQSVVLDYFPRVKVVHTSPHKEGEVYSPEVNYILMFLCVVSILGLNGKALGNAFGVVVSLVMIITTLLLTLVMVMIWRKNIVVVALFFFTFFIIEGVYVSAVLTKIPQGGWLPFAVSLILALVMFVWFYGRQRKLEYEMTYKISLQNLDTLLAIPGIKRVPGLCFFYSNIQDGLTPVLGHYIKNTRSLHKITVFTTLRYLLVAKVPQHERIIVGKMGLRGLYSCIIQYGYADCLSQEENSFSTQVINSLQEHIHKCRDVSSVEDELLELERAKTAGVVHVKGKTRFSIGDNIGWFDKIMLGLYEILHSNCRSSLPALSLPLEQRIEVGMLYKA